MTAVGFGSLIGILALLKLISGTQHRPLCCIVNPVGPRYKGILFCCEARNRCVDHHAPGCARRFV